MNHIENHNGKRMMTFRIYLKKKKHHHLQISQKMTKNPVEPQRIRTDNSQEISYK